MKKYSATVNVTLNLQILLSWRYIKLAPKRKKHSGAHNVPPNLQILSIRWYIKINIKMKNHLSCTLHASRFTNPADRKINEYQEHIKKPICCTQCHLKFSKSYWFEHTFVKKQSLNRINDSLVWKSMKENANIAG